MLTPTSTLTNGAQEDWERYRRDVERRLAVKQYLDFETDGGHVYRMKNEGDDSIEPPVKEVQNS